MTAIQALRQCIEAMKLVDFKDCAESADLWHKFNLAQANAERVLRDGEKQEPVAQRPFGYVATLSTPAGTVYHMSRVMQTERDAKVCAGQWKSSSKADVLALYAHPAPSLQAVVEVPKPVAETFALYKAVNEMMAHIGMVGRMESDHPTVDAVMNALWALDSDKVEKRVDELMEKAFMPCYAATKTAVSEFIAITEDAAPQPPAAPSGDVERDNALRVARAALKTADSAIKGREHTGFIHNAIAVIDAATKD